MSTCLQLLPIHTMLVMAAGLHFLFLKQDKTRPFVNTFITQVGHLADIWRTQITLRLCQNS